MDERQSLIGFTEAELGFFVALLVIVLWLVTSRPVPAAQNTIATLSVDSLRKLQHAAESTSSATKSRDSLLKLVQGHPKPNDTLRSAILPNCATLRRLPDPIGTLEIVGEGSVIFNGQAMSIPEFASTTRAIREPMRTVCLFHVVVRVDTMLRDAISTRAREAISAMGFRITTRPPVME